MFLNFKIKIEMIIKIMYIFYRPFKYWTEIIKVTIFQPILFLPTFECHPLIFQKIYFFSKVIRLQQNSSYFVTNKSFSSHPATDLQLEILLLSLQYRGNYVLHHAYSSQDWKNIKEMSLKQTAEQTTEKFSSFLHSNFLFHDQY